MPLVLLALLACRRHDAAPDDASSTPPAQGRVIVLWSLDTLGQVAADDTDWCADLQAQVAPYDLDADCLDGAISPSSWTPEAHTRVLWPSELAGAGQAEIVPECGQTSLMRTLADAVGGDVILGLDNAIFGGGVDSRDPYRVCPDGLSSWAQDADQVYVATDPSVAFLPEDEHAAHQAIDAVVDDIAAGRPVVVELNSFEVGGHQPRCWFDPDSAACRQLWQTALDHGLAQPTDDPTARWSEIDFFHDVSTAAARDLGATDEPTLRGLMWDTMVQNIDHYKGDGFDSRLTRLLDALKAAGRLDDLTLVAFGDHGENPCVADPARGWNCEHNGTPTEWTALVPVYTVPASLGQKWAAEGIVGGDGVPWPLANIAWGMVDDVGVDPPPAWPAMPAPGAAKSWSCSNDAGLSVVGATSLRCTGGGCSGATFAVPDGIDYDPTPTDIAPALAADAGTGHGDDWVDAICR